MPRIRPFQERCCCPPNSCWMKAYGWYARIRWPVSSAKYLTLSPDGLVEPMALNYTYDYNVVYSDTAVSRQWRIAGQEHGRSEQEGNPREVGGARCCRVKPHLLLRSSERILRSDKAANGLAEAQPAVSFNSNLGVNILAIRLRG